MYCSIDDVKNLDNKNITDDIDDRVIEEHIRIAMVQVDYFTKNTFGNNPPLSIIKATAIITLSLLQQDNLLDTKEIVSERVDIVNITYGKSNQNNIPNKAIRLMKPYCKKRKPFIDRI